jgi:N-methylhydantoinase B/oxoprolinase/acetone carboxylase alpha subunit
MDSEDGSTVDPVKFEVIRYALVAATEEMASALRRSAYSTNVKTRADFSCAFFDRDMRLVAQSFSQPVHLGSMVELVPRGLRAYGAERLGPGDALVTNHPYIGGVHLNDVTVISPVCMRMR